jgi:formamidopyrimidine-DNA glycosylase
MPEGNEVHRFRDRHHATFTGHTVRVDSPSGQFADATALDRRKLRGIHARGKHLGYDFGRHLILHVHLGRFGDFNEGTMPLAKPEALCDLDAGRHGRSANRYHPGQASSARVGAARRSALCV